MLSRFLGPRRRRCTRRRSWDGLLGACVGLVSKCAHAQILLCTALLFVASSDTAAAALCVRSRVCSAPPRSAVPPPRLARARESPPWPRWAPPCRLAGFARRPAARLAALAWRCARWRRRRRRPASCGRPTRGAPRRPSRCRSTPTRRRCPTLWLSCAARRRSSSRARCAPAARRAAAAAGGRAAAAQSDSAKPTFLVARPPPAAPRGCLVSRLRAHRAAASAVRPPGSAHGAPGAFRDAHGS
jgi:hypothetical protein